MKKLPARPNLEQLKKQAKALLKNNQASSLAAAQQILAKEYGFANWSALKAYVLAHQDAPADVVPLLQATAKGDIQRATELLAAHPSLLNQRGGDGTRTALHVAAISKREEMVRFLLEHGADPNIRCEGDSATPLHFAAENGQFEIVRLLVEHGCDPIGEGDYHELGVIGWASGFGLGAGNKEIVDYLIAHGGRHNIFSAVAMGDVEAIRKLVAQSPALLEGRMERTNQRRRPLHLAIVKKQEGSLVTLLDLGADLESLDEAGFTPLDQAAISGETKMAQILLDRGAKVRLPAAAALGRTRDMEKLLRQEPDALKPGNRWGNLIVRAATQSPGSVVESLILAGASVNVRDDPTTAIDSTSGYTPLHAAAFHGNTSAASVLLKYGADVRTREEKYHGTPAGWAHYAGHMEVRDLIAAGPIDLVEIVDFGLADRIPAALEQEPEALNRPMSDYPLYPLYVEAWYTPLALAVSHEHVDTVRTLLEQGATRTDRILELAQKIGNEQIITLLRD